ncbi:MAG: CPBP family intramembrane metalloprotease [Gammaproteobacteria bacterium]|nr:CPBP family intramembrane metalloprotease [Gammaproteobacteria bacterium]
MEKALLTAGILIVPTILLVIGFKMTGRKVELAPLLWAGFACLVYFLLLRSRGAIPNPGFMDELGLNWFGKTLSIAGTIAILYFLPRVGFRAAGLTWKQDKDSLDAVIRTGGIILLVSTGAAFLIATTPNTSVENLLWQATMPGLDEELFFRGLLLLLLHQAFGKGLRVWGAETGWGFWLVVVIFGLLHGVTVQDGGPAVNFWVILSTGFIGFVVTWMRERTGSLVVPVLFHNITNVAQAFV